MLTFSDMKRIPHSKTIGEIVKETSDFVMEETWDNDLESRVAYLYDWFHDDHKTVLNNLNSAEDSKKIPIDIKYLTWSSQTFSKDQVTYHIQMKPSQECNVDYYDEFFGKKYDATFPCGLYIDIPDEKKRYNRWLVVGLAQRNDQQFPTYEVLRCDYVFRWIYKGKKYLMPGVTRSQNSYKL